MEIVEFVILATGAQTCRGGIQLATKALGI
jgi:hypothetical protein